MSNDTVKQQQIANEINQIDEKMTTALETFKLSIQTDQVMSNYNEVVSLRNEFNNVRDEIIQAALNGENTRANTLLQQAAEITSRTDTSIETLFTNKRDNGNQISDNLSATSRNTMVTMIFIVIVSMLLAIVLGIIISRSISNPVNRLVQSANRVAAGDLSVDIDVNSRDEIGLLADAFRNMSDNLNDVMSNIAAASDQVASGARQMAESSMLLSQGATEQASSVEQLTVSLEEVSTTIKTNADSAVEAIQGTNVTMKNAETGNERMQEMLAAMNDINSSSSSISKIIKVIDEIAFQTNILALNAAVEAARAGQHGKGFAVVAEEVRNLAARSANAAKETTELIEGSISKVDEGMKIANETAAALTSIMTDISAIAQLARNNADSSSEQAVSVAQINQGLLQVSQVIQTNSATSEETAAASEELTGQAEMLKEQVSRFKLKPKAEHSYYNNSFGTRSFSHLSANINGRTSKADSDFAEAAASMESFGDKDFGKY